MRYREIDLGIPKRISRDQYSVTLNIMESYKSYVKYLFGETEKLRINYPLTLEDVKAILNYYKGKKDE